MPTLTERLLQFPTKNSPVPADVLYVGDSANSFNEVKSTIAEIVAAYPNLSGIAALSITANKFIYSNNTNVLSVASISDAAVSMLAYSSAALILNYLGGLPLTGGTMLGGIDMGSQSISNLATPSNPNDAASKFYVDSIATGGGVPCYAATTANLNATQSGAGVGATLTNAGAQAVFTLDGTTPPLNSRILVKDQTTNTQNGVYTLTNVGSVSTNWVLTRATDYDTPTQINDVGMIPISNGTINANSGWYNTTVMVTVDTTPITFVQISASYPISLANGGTGGALTASNGGVVYSTASKLAILAGTATAGLALLSGANAPPTWSTKPPITKINIQKITSSQTYTASSNLVGADVVIVGAGGGGGATTTTAGGQSSAGGGGGSGAYARLYYTAAQLGASASVTIGLAGSAGTVPGGSGGAGGNSTFVPTGTGATLTANGGSPGAGAGTSAGPTLSATGGGGGSASGGSLNVNGGSGLPGYVYSPGVAPIPGMGGTNPLSSNAFDGAGAGGVGQPGKGYGGGGAGSYLSAFSTQQNGGGGSAGVCYITEYISI